MPNAQILDVQLVHDLAHAAGMAAGNDAKPTPMRVVGQGCDEVVEGGPCGFAWVSFKGNTAFGRAMKKLNLASPGYPTGLQVWVGEFGQSMARKSAYARAYAAVLRGYGIDAYPQSRMD